LSDAYFLLKDKVSEFYTRGSRTEGKQGRRNSPSDTSDYAEHSLRSAV